MDPFKTGIRAIDETAGGILPASNLLLLAPPFAGADHLAYRLAHPGESDYTIVVSADSDALDVEDSFGLSEEERQRLWIIDCITRTMEPTVTDSDQVKYVASPVDLTGMGIKFTRILEEIRQAEAARGVGEVPRVRVCVNSLSSFLIYSKLEAIYRFFHILSARVRRMNGVAIYLLNPVAVDEKTISTLEQLMNGAIMISADDRGDGVWSLNLKTKSGVVVRDVHYRVSGNELVVVEA
jgi:KaiC/GvpD/RAD55 family RecA-like ATPase